MPIIVVGGHARNVGKTSVVAGLISAFPQYSWTAIKISSHQHQEFEKTRPYSREELESIAEKMRRYCGSVVVLD